MSATRTPRPVCEVERAYRELVGRASAETPAGAHPCSPEPAEVREYPLSPSGGPRYVLCNGHLRDLFDEIARLPRPAAPAGTH